MDFFSKLDNDFKPLTILTKKAPSLIFGGDLNRPLNSVRKLHIVNDKR